MKINKKLFLALSYSIIIVFLSLIQIESQTNISNLDKYIHSIIYFIFCILWLHPIKLIFKSRPIIIVFIFSILFGFMIEFLQGILTDYRNADHQDVLFNLLGSLIACSFLYIKKT